MPEAIPASDRSRACRRRWRVAWPVVADPQLVDHARAEERLVIDDRIQRLLRGVHAARRHGAIGRVDVAVAVEHARVERLIVGEAVIDARRNRVLGLFRLGGEGGECQQGVGGRHGALGESSEERRHRLRPRRALARPAANRLTGPDAANGFGTRHGLGERQADRLLEALVAAEEERPVARDRSTERAAELVELEFLFLVVVLTGRVEGVVRSS